MGRKRAHQGRRRGSGGGPRRQHQVLHGTIHVARPGVATLDTPEGSFPVARGGIREAMDGDEVHAHLIERRGKGQMVVVRDVVSRATETFVGTYGTADPLGVVVPLDARLRRDFFVLPDDHSAERLGVAEGDVVRARILEFPARGSAGVVTIDARLGSADALDLDIEAIIASFGLATAFSPAALAEAEELRADVDETLAAEPRRRDLRERLTVTIDPTDARDFDDAVAARRTDEGFELDVHIADVSHYVPWGTSLDLEARGRTCSTYLVDRVLPMLPERLSNDLCSLRPCEDRLAMSVLMRLGRRGEVTSFEVTPSAICSASRLDYDTVDRLLGGDVAPEELPVETERAQEVAEALRTLDEVARLRRALRHQRGAVDFETRESKVLLDEAGRPVGVSVRERTAATSLVEEAMLLANECVAKLLATSEMPAAFRTHEPPSPDDLKATAPVLRELELLRADEEAALVAGSPSVQQAVLRRAKGTSAAPLVSTLLLRAQKRAIYQPENLGHYALGADAYCHFTSPIRRYPDLVVHRAIKTLQAGPKARGSRTQRAIERSLPQVCRDCSDRERVADAAGRASQKVKMAELFAERIGESFSGVVMGCERFGLFVTLDDTGAEGLLPVRALGDEWFDYDEARLCLTSESTGRTWRVGQRVAVRVVRVDPSRGQIDFALAEGSRRANVG